MRFSVRRVVLCAFGLAAAGLLLVTWPHTATPATASGGLPQPRGPAEGDPHDAHPTDHMGDLGGPGQVQGNPDAALDRVPTQLHPDPTTTSATSTTTTTPAAAQAQRTVEPLHGRILAPAAMLERAETINTLQTIHNVDRFPVVRCV